MNSLPVSGGRHRRKSRKISGGKDVGPSSLTGGKRKSGKRRNNLKKSKKQTKTSSCWW